MREPPTTADGLGARRSRVRITPNWIISITRQIPHPIPTKAATIPAGSYLGEDSEDEGEFQNGASESSGAEDFLRCFLRCILRYILRLQSGG